MIPRRVRDVSKRVAHNVWHKYVPAKDRGVMYPIMDESLSVQERQSMGAKYTADKRSRTTSERITQARLERPSATQSEIATQLNVHTRTVQRYWNRSPLPPSRFSVLHARTRSIPVVTQVGLEEGNERVSKGIPREGSTKSVQEWDLAGVAPWLRNRYPRLNTDGT
jgi:hypothetical protein